MIEKNLALKTYGFSATDPESKGKFFALIGQMLSNIFSSQVATAETPAA